MNNFLYRVREDESIAIIASKFNTGKANLIKFNKLVSEVEEGDILEIVPLSGKRYIVKVTDTLESIGKKFSESVEKIKTKNQIEFIYPFMELFI